MQRCARLRQAKARVIARQVRARGTREGLAVCHARLRESHGASWGRVALARPSGNVLVLAVGGGVLIAAYVTSSIVSIAGAVSGAKTREETIEGCFHTSAIVV